MALYPRSHTQEGVQLLITGLGIGTHQGLAMNCISFLIRAFAAAGVLAVLGVASVKEAYAQENASPGYREASKPPMSVESLETYTLVKLNRVYFRYEASNLSPKEKIAL